MDKKYSFFALFLLMAIQPGRGKVFLFTNESVSPPDDGYELVWSEEFNEDGDVDTSVWNFENGFVRNHEDQWYRQNNAYCRDGCLVIEAKQVNLINPLYQEQTRDWRAQRERVHYTSASINTRGKYSFLYGRMEVRAAIPVAGGAWPAIWTLGEGMPWPSCGEIDVMEYYRINGVPHILANAAWGDNRPSHAVWNSKRIPFQHFLDKDPLWTDKFHVWRMDWDEKEIALYLDDELLNLALGGDNGGTIDDNAFPMFYFVDYVRVYQKK